ncbi:MAG TPA: glycosyltransferase [Gemmatimonadales bacterium]|nr:glycosyltransferase [Gemmatimonadales bacterium]
MSPRPEPGLVSVVIPCYNAEAYLAAAIRSALNQTHPAIEVIVVDDGSSDGSRLVAASFGDRITLLAEPHRGGNAARNAGVARARGEYILMLDADDVLGPTCAASRAEVLAAEPEVGLVAGHYREIDAAGALLPRIPEVRRLGPLAPFRQAVRRNWGPPVGWVFRREAYERCGGFDPLLRSCQDWDFVIRVALRYRIAYVPRAEAFYRKLPGSVSSDPGRMLTEMARLQRKNRAYAESGWRYRIDCALGRFELGRRVLHASLTGAPLATAVPRTLLLVARRPSLVWIGALSAITFVAGKRPSAKSHAPAPASVPA